MAADFAVINLGEPGPRVGRLDETDASCLAPSLLQFRSSLFVRSCARVTPEISHTPTRITSCGGPFWVSLLLGSLVRRGKNSTPLLPPVSFLS